MGLILLTHVPSGFFCQLCREHMQTLAGSLFCVRSGFNTTQPTCLSLYCLFNASLVLSRVTYLQFPVLSFEMTQIV